MPALRPIRMAEGELRRNLKEQARAYCRECNLFVSEWTTYGNALGLFIDHRRTKHHESQPDITEGD